MTRLHSARSALADDLRQKGGIAVTEDRFMTYEQMTGLSKELHAAGFEHVIVSHLIDPEWQKNYRPGWASKTDVMWSVRLHDYLVPMPQIKKLIEICERHGMTFWFSVQYANTDEDTGGSEIYVRVVSPESNTQTRL